MSTMNISLPEPLKAFVEEQTNKQNHGSSSEYIRALIRRDLERQRLRDLLLDGAGSPQTEPVDEAYFAGLRNAVESTVQE